MLQSRFSEMNARQSRSVVVHKSISLLAVLLCYGKKTARDVLACKQPLLLRLNMLFLVFLGFFKGLVVSQVVSLLKAHSKMSLNSVVQRRYIKIGIVVQKL